MMDFKPIILWTDALIYVLIAVVAAFVWQVRRHEHLAAPWRRVVHSAGGMASLVVLAFFAAVGLLDSVHFRPALETKNAGARVYSVDVLSLLDVVTGNLRKRQEKTYSAPLAAHLYAKETVERPESAQTREFRGWYSAGAPEGSGTGTDGRPDGIRLQAPWEGPWHGL